MTDRFAEEKARERAIALVQQKFAHAAANGVQVTKAELIRAYAAALRRSE